MIYTIYKISIGNEDYIGSTKDLKQRKSQHKYDCNTLNNQNYNFPLYQSIRTNGGWDCCEITPIDEFDCETRQQALIREEYWRREYKALLNKKRAFRTEAELKEDLKKNKKRQCENKTNCECGGKYDDVNKAKHFKTKRHQEFKQSASNSVLTV
jgi:predicted GIY-YIG superfamily endonuclease